MAFDPFYASSPSDSGLLNAADLPFTSAQPGGHTEPERADTNLPSRDEYDAPEPGAIDAEAPEDSLRDVPLPEGYMARLRGFVSDL